MANTNLNTDKITRAALDILHQETTFLHGVNRQYDSQYARTGAKIGASLRVRLPNQYLVRSGAVMNVGDVEQRKETVTMATQKGIDVEFTSEELTLDIDDFRENILRPQISTLASVVENDVLSNVTKDVFQMVDDDGAALDIHSALQAGEKLTNSLAPRTNRSMLLSPAGMVKVVDSAKALFAPTPDIAEQYREGLVSRNSGFDWAESTHVMPHTTGTAAEGDTAYNINGAGQTGSSLTVDTGTTTLLKGDVITIAGVNRVHPETKEDTGVLQQFVVTADSGATATTLAISPELNPTATDAWRNVSASPANGAAVNKIGGGNADTLTDHLAYHKDAFVFVSADLVMPSVGEASIQQFEGFSMRVWKGSDITNDSHPHRIDILYGFKTVRPQLACRVHADG